MKFDRRKFIAHLGGMGVLSSTMLEALAAPAELLLLINKPSTHAKIISH